MRILLLYLLVWLLLWRLTVCCSACGCCAAVPLCLLQVNFEKVWDEMQSSLVSLVSGVPQTLSNEKWLEMYSYVALLVSVCVGTVLFDVFRVPLCRCGST